MKIKKSLNIQKVNNVLLIDPAFPISRKSRNHKDLLPVGLLKIGAFLKSKNINVKLLRLNVTKDVGNFNPDIVLVTSIFTYWANEVKNAVLFSKSLFPEVPVVVGGVFASLSPIECKKLTGCDEVFVGTVKGAESIAPDYSLLGEDADTINYQIIHSTRGCKRKCGFCGVYKIEPEFICKRSVKQELIRKNLVFYDNNLLASPCIEDLLNELIELKKNKVISRCESQSGFDGRILRKKPYLAKMLKEANFKDPKLAWDGSFKSRKNREKEVNILVNAGYNPKEISVFMIYNYDLDYIELEQKRVECFKWGVQVSDCRYRPLDRFDDNYNPYARKPQSNKDYHINPNWTDELVRLFRRNVRQHNICIRHGINYYSADAERKRISKEDSLKYRDMEFDEVKKYLSDAWNPLEIHYLETDKTIQSKLV